MGVDIHKYDEDVGPPHGSNVDEVKMNVSMTANSRIPITYEEVDPISSDFIASWRLNDRVNYTDVGDDWGTWVDFPEWFKFRFYGGQYSAEYGSVWVCSNGFISFDLSNSNSSSPTNIPSDTAPNALIAALWTDLHTDSSSILTTGWYEGWLPGRFDTWNYFVITWYNFLADETRLTFQIALEIQLPWSEEYNLNRQSDVRFDYKSVSSIPYEFAYGIEDQEGLKGNGGLHDGTELSSLNGKHIRYRQNSSNFFLTSLILEFEDSNPDWTRYDIWEEYTDYARGYNLEIESGEEGNRDPDYRFARALASTTSLLISTGGVIASVATWPVTLPIGYALVTLGWVNYFAGDQLDNIDLECRDSFTDPPSPPSGPAYIDALAIPFAVDASLNVGFAWIFDDLEWDETHSLTITAKAEYYEYNRTSGERIDNDWSTSVNLEISPDTNDNLDSAEQINVNQLYPRLYVGGYDTNDFYRFNVQQGRTITVEAEAEPNNYGEPDFELHLYDPLGTDVASTPHGYSHSLSYSIDSSGTWFIEARIFRNQGFYQLTVEAGGGGGGCPFVYTWNGEEYVIDNNILPASELSNGTDVEDCYRLERNLVPQNGKYQLLISEFEQEHSYIDQVKLLAVDHDSDVNIAVTADGEILTYKNPATPLSAVDNNGTNRINELLYMDGNVSDPATHFYGEAGDYLVLNFGQISSQDAKLILRDDMKSMIICIEVQVLDANGVWQTVVVLSPRDYWSIEAVNLSAYIVQGQDFLVRLFWTSPHRLDYVGLDTTEQEEFELKTGNLVSATHSTQGDVKNLLKKSDNDYAELVPSQQIQLEFTLPDNSRQARTYILCTEGHYYTIQT